jgi:predicted DNA-binding transcriptional regulator YafY
LPPGKKTAKVPRPGRPAGRFTQHRRLDRLRDVLEREPAGLRLSQLAALLRVTERSVRRYLEELEAKTEIESVETTPGGPHIWRLKPSEKGRTVILRRAQAYGLLASRGAFEVYRGSAFFDAMDVAMRSLRELVQRPLRPGTKGEIAGDRSFENRFSFCLGAHPTHAGRGEDMDTVILAAAELRPLSLRLRGVEGRARAVVFHPYALAQHEGALFLIGAMAQDQGEISVVPFDATSDLHVVEGPRFELPEDFDATQYHHGAQGISATVTGRVMIEFDATAAPIVRTHRFHPAQKIATASDGRVRLVMPLADVEAVVRLVLSFGEGARVVEPEVLVNLVQERLARTLQRYAR